MKTFALMSLILAMNLVANNGINSPMILPAVGNTTVLESQTDKELLWVNEQIRAIIPPRVGVADGYINSLIDPIKYFAPVHLPSIGGSSLLAPPKLGSMSLLQKIVEEPLRLQALMNKSALINGKWYKLNDTVRGYTLSEVKQNSVLLIGKKSRPLILFLSKSNNSITINTK